MTPADEIARRLDAVYPDAGCTLDHANAFQLLIATILSAQCTDERVNQITPELFRQYPDAAAFAAAPQEAIEAAIRSAGFYRNKAKAIQGACARLLAAYGGEVPRTMAELLTLPGVARKTANVVLGTGFGIAEGIAVDTHVRRLAGRLGLSSHSDPEKIERDLMAQFPRERWIRIAHQLIRHGRLICKAQRPECERCFLADLCPSAGKVAARGQGEPDGGGRTQTDGRRRARPRVRSGRSG